jgi:hypothetical protein
MTGPGTTPRDRDLGLDAPISRRDFVQGALVLALGGSALPLAAGCIEPPRTRPSGAIGFAGSPSSGA